MSALLHEQVFESEGRAWNVAVGPASGPPLILFHGVTRRWQSFLPLLPELGLRHQVFAVDFPGHGGSDRTSRGYRVADYMARTAALLSLPPFSTQRECLVYGHSLGSMVAAAVAAEFPARVRAVILEDPPFDTMGQRMRQTPLFDFFTALTRLAGSTESIAALTSQLAEVRMTDPPTGHVIRFGDVRDATSLRFSARCLQQLDPRVLEPIVAGEWLDGFDWRAVLRGIDCPALLLQADPAAGGMLVDADAEEARSLTRDLTHIRFPGTGHVIHWMATPTLLRHVTAFLESL